MFLSSEMSFVHHLNHRDLVSISTEFNYFENKALSKRIIDLLEMKMVIQFYYLLGLSLVSLVQKRCKF